LRLQTFENPCLGELELQLQVEYKYLDGEKRLVLADSAMPNQTTQSPEQDGHHRSEVLTFAEDWMLYSSKVVKELVSVREKLQ
jgi:hypothetical protein